MQEVRSSLLKGDGPCTLYGSVIIEDQSAHKDEVPACEQDNPASSIS